MDELAGESWRPTLGESALEFEDGSPKTNNTEAPVSGEPACPVHELPSPEALRKQVARLIVFGFHETKLSGHARRMIAEGAGGVIIFARNYVNPQQMADLCASLKREAGERPLLIMVDQEGGRVMRLGPPFSRVPLPSVIGATGDEKAAAAAGIVLGRELRAVNIDMDLAPVVDVHTNPRNPVIGTRAFGTTPDLVCKMAYAFIRGLQQQGVASCAKHYPGHGDTHVDSHLELPLSSCSLSRLQAVEMPPFQTAVDADGAAVMVAHVAVPALAAAADGARGSSQGTGALLPSTLDRGALQYLRGHMRFDGVLVSDCMEMGAIVKHFTLPGACERGLAAGIDMFLICHTEDRQRAAIDGIVDAVQSGRVPYSRVVDANRRIDDLAHIYCRPASGLSFEEQDFARSRLEFVGCQEHQAIVSGIIEQSKRKE